MRKNWVNPAAVIGVLALAVGVWIGGSRQGVPPAGSQVAPAPSPAAAAPRAAIDTAHETTFVALAPCRLVNTAKAGGTIRPGAVRYFKAVGTSFTSQGGASCGIPAGATAIAAAITATDASGSGVLKAWQAGAAEPTSTFLSYVKAIPLRGSGVVRLNTASTNAFRIATYTHSTNVTVDVTGYYIGHLWAHINPDASIAASSRVTGAVQLAGQAYKVSFDRDITRCAYQVTNESLAATSSAYPFPGDNRALYVAIANSSNGNNLSSAFSVFVSC